MVEELATREMFNPIFTKLGDMVGAARDAFNRHSGISLEQLKTLHGELAHTSHQGQAEADGSKANGRDASHQTPSCRAPSGF